MFSAYRFGGIAIALHAFVCKASINARNQASVKGELKIHDLLYSDVLLTLAQEPFALGLSTMIYNV